MFVSTVTDQSRKFVFGCVETYRYGFNGKENDVEANSTGEGTQDYGARIYNPSLGKFLSVDPLFRSFAFYSPYQFSGNRPIVAIDMDGGEDTWIHATKYPDGTYLVVKDGKEIESDCIKAQNAVQFNMPQLKEGGILYTEDDYNVPGSIRVKEYIPDVVIKPGLLNYLYEVLTNPTGPIFDALETVAYAMQELGTKMTGKMENYGKLEGDEGRKKVSEVVHTINDFGEMLPGIIGKAFSVNDKLWTFMDIAADLEKSRGTTATVRVVSDVAGDLIDSAVEKGLPATMGETKRKATEFTTKKMVDELVKDPIIDAAESKDQQNDTQN